QNGSSGASESRFSPRSPRPPTSAPFPYTTLFRSQHPHGAREFPSMRRTTRRQDLEQIRHTAKERGELAFDIDKEKQLRSHDQPRSEEHTSELQSQSNLVCRLLLETKQCTPTHPSQ